MTSFKKFLEEEISRDPEFKQEFEETRQEMSFALALALRREALGLTQQALAEKTGIKQPMIARIEHGQMPTAPTLQRLAKGLKVRIVISEDEIVLIPIVERRKRRGRHKDDSPELYVKMSEIDFEYRQKMGGLATAYKVSEDETVSFTS
jgi:transcriptional regulator with XRE-family HTH domain